MRVDVILGSFCSETSDLRLARFNNIILESFYLVGDNTIEFTYKHTEASQYRDVKPGDSDDDIFAWPADSMDKLEGFIIDGVEYMRGDKGCKEYYEDLQQLMHDVMVENVLSKIESQ